MTEENRSLFELNISPYKQGLYCISGLLLVNLVSLILSKYNADFLPRTYWTNAMTFTFVYAIFNAMFSLSSTDENKYWLASLLTYAALCISGGSLAFLFSGISIDEAGSYRWIYTVFTMVYILILVIIRTMRRIVILAQKKDKRMRGEE